LCYCGGTRRSLLESLSKSSLPSLQHLEIWLGSEDYGCDITPEDIKLFLDSLYTQKNIPYLKTLGFKNYHFQDEIVEILFQSELVKQQIVHIDISEGTLSDTGASILLQCLKEVKYKHLVSIDCHHNYISTKLINHLNNLNEFNINLDANEKNDRYVSISE
jgi:hypothetical protein